MSLPWPDLTTEEWEALLAKEAKQAPKALTYREKLQAFLLGGAGSGNFGHAGRPGEVGGSAGEGGTAGTTGVVFAETEEIPGVVKVGEKKDGGQIAITQTLVTPETEARVFGADHDAAAIVGQMVEDVPGDLRVAMHSQYIPPKDATSLDAPHNVVMVSVTGADGLQIQRSFTREADGSLTVRHVTFKVPESAQGKGLAKAVLADSLHAYRALGVSKITTFANMEVGGYAWAKFGFKAWKPADTAIDLSQTMYDLQDENVITRHEMEAMREVITAHKTDPTLPWHVAGIVSAEGKPLGKTLLQASGWEGELHLDDAEAVARLEHYIKGH